jgi:ketosteroid isomerase-like protein
LASLYIRIDWYISFYSRQLHVF